MTLASAIALICRAVAFLRSILFGPRVDRAAPSIRQFASDAAELALRDAARALPTPSQRADILHATTQAGVAEARRRWHAARGETAAAERQGIVRDDELDTLANYAFAGGVRVQAIAFERSRQAADWWERALVRGGLALIDVALPG